MTICFLAIEHHSQGSGGGIASYLEAIVTELVRLEHKVHIIVKGRSNREYSLADGCKMHEFAGGNLHWYISKVPLLGKVLALPLREIEWSWGFYRTFRLLKKKVEFDLIESAETGNLFIALTERSIPFVIRLHGSTYSFEKATRGRPSLGSRLDRALQRMSLRRAEGISAPSMFQKGMFETEMGTGFNVTIIPNPIKRGNPARVDKLNGENLKIIFYAGRLADVKGVWTLLKAFVRISADKPEARVVMAGPPHVSIPDKAIRSFLNDHHIADKVELVGHVQRDKMDDYYERCSVYAAPSQYETFCLSAVEAMLYGKPVVGTLGTALPEVVEDGVTGLLVPPGDEGALADALLKLLNDDGLARRMGEAGRLKAMKQYQVNIIASKTLQFYGQTIVGGIVL